MSISVQVSKDGKHKTISHSGDYDYSLHCNVSNECVTLSVSGGYTHCMLCGEELREWEKPERILL